MMQRGSDRPKSKLTDERVVEIRVALAAGERQCDIAARFRVSHVTIYKISTGEAWKHAEAYP